MAEFTSKWLNFGADTGKYATDKTDRKPTLIVATDPCQACGSRLRRGGRWAGYYETRTSEIVEHPRHRDDLNARPHRVHTSEDSEAVDRFLSELRRGQEWLRRQHDSYLAGDCGAASDETFATVLDEWDTRDSALLSTALGY